jgi:hypothetical protein
MIDQSHIKNGIRNYGQHITFNSMKTPYDNTCPYCSPRRIFKIIDS